MRYKILNTSIDSFDRSETLKRIVTSIEDRKPIYQVSINAGKINLIDENPRLKKIIDQADIVNADGMSIIWGAKFLHIPIKSRVTGIDLFYDLLKISEQKNYSIYFLGATSESMEGMIKLLKKNHPRLNIAGYHDGYFKKSEEIVNEINKAKPDILFLGFSSPQKEFWIDDYKDRMNIPFIMGVGGSFDVYSGKTKRAPKIIQNLGLEWFYRFIQEPIRLYDRYIIGNLRFTKKLLREMVK